MHGNIGPAHAPVLAKQRTVILFRSVNRRRIAWAKNDTGLQQYHFLPRQFCGATTSAVCSRI